MNRKRYIMLISTSKLTTYPSLSPTLTSHLPIPLTYPHLPPTHPSHLPSPPTYPSLSPTLTSHLPIPLTYPHLPPTHPSHLPSPPTYPSLSPTLTSHRHLFTHLYTTHLPPHPPIYLQIVGYTTKPYQTTTCIHLKLPLGIL